jgi:histidine triad (HIT) family protein
MRHHSVWLPIEDPGNAAPHRDTTSAMSVPDCLFCKIVAGEIPAKKLYEDEHAIAFTDINPQAPVHVLIVPRRHISSHAQATRSDASLLGHMLNVASEIAQQQGLGRGYRTVINTGPDGGQTVDHLHMHLLGGRAMHWPPG